MARFSPSMGATSAIEPMAARSASSSAAAGPPGRSREQQLGDLEGDAGAGQPRRPGSGCRADAG